MSTCTDVTDGSCFGNNAAPVPIQIPGTNALEVFYRGSDNQLRAFQWHERNLVAGTGLRRNTQKRSLSGAGTGREPNTGLLPGSGIGSLSLKTPAREGH